MIDTEGTHRQRTRPGYRVTLVTVAPVAAVALIVAATWVGLHMHREARLTVEVAVAEPHRPFLVSGAAEPALMYHYLPVEAGALSQYFGELGYTLDQVRDKQEAVPRIFVSRLPDDIEQMQVVERRKRLFVRAVLPLVLRENDRLLQRRERLQRLHERVLADEPLSEAEQRWLSEQFAAFGTDDGDWHALMRRVDVIPPSLAIAQAATESGWGTSRFVREGNALFGMWTWSEDIPGIVPEEREEGATHRIRAFGTLQGSVRAYMHTLNVGWAYNAFRASRAKQREKGRPLEGLALTHTLSRYSEQREFYVRYLNRIIRGNRLAALDHARLSSGGVAEVYPWTSPRGVTATVVETAQGDET